MSNVKGSMKRVVWQALFWLVSLNCWTWAIMLKCLVLRHRLLYCDCAYPGRVISELLDAS